MSLLYNHCKEQKRGMHLRKSKDQMFNFIKLHVKGGIGKSGKIADVLESLNWAQNYMCSGLTLGRSSDISGLMSSVKWSESQKR